jgi:diguanylate cyclase (GGDEF)-like protein
VAAFILLGLVGVMGVAESAAQRQGRRDLQDRFDIRAASAASFLQSTAESTLRREQDLATDRLGGDVSQREFTEFLAGFGFGPALLLDNHGRVLRVAPADPDLLGVELASGYDHLSTALRGRAAVSNAVLSAVDRQPVVAFAVPLDTPAGPRVFSGAYDVASSPMGVYLDHANPFTGGSVYLLDATGQVISAGGGGTASLADRDPTLADALAGSARGIYRADGDSATYYVAEPVAGTPWSIVLAVPTASLYLPLDRTSRVLPWLFLGAFAVAAALLASVLVRGREARGQLRVDAGVDGLTNVDNRRSAEALLRRLMGRDGVTPGGVAVLMIDVDHFKQVNDRYGHATGDDALRSVAQTIRRCLRTCDVLGRWGGEEFLVALPRTGEDGAREVAERIRVSMIEDVVASNGHVVPLTVSIGGAVARPGEVLADLVAAADAGLYQAKRDGRNCVRVNACRPSGERDLVAPASA